MTKFVLGLDQGTTSSRAIVFGHDGRAVGSAQQEFEQLLPRPGHVEHDPEAIWSSQLAVARQALAAAGISAADLAAVGVTNQRETTILWERDTGRPVANAMVWQSRASAGICEQLKADGLEAVFRDKTGLVIDAYFSGTKIKYLLDQIDGLRLAGRARRNPVRYRRLVPDLAADGRPAARDRCEQRQPDAGFQHPHARLGRRVAAIARRPASDVAGGAAVQPQLWGHHGGLAGRGGAHRRKRRRPASGDVRPSVLRTGRGQEHVRYRLLHVDEHRGPAAAVAEQPADHHRLEPGRARHVLPGRFRVHRRRRGPMAARRAGTDPQFGRGRSLGRLGAGQRRCRARAGLYGPRRTALGPLRSRSHVRHHARHDRRALGTGGAGIDGLPKPRPAGCHAARRGYPFGHAQGRRRRVRERSVDAVPSGHPGRGGPPSGGRGNDGAGSRLPGRPRRGLLARAGRHRPQLGLGPRIPAAHWPRTNASAATPAGPGP